MKKLLTALKLRRYVKVTVYLRSGQSITFKCREWEANGFPPSSGENGLKSYSFKRIKGQVIFFDISEIIAIVGDNS